MRQLSSQFMLETAPATLAVARDHAARRLRRVDDRLLQRAILLVVALGIALRIWKIFHRPYLWVDEAHLVPNVLDRRWDTLFTPAVNEQMTPFGWLALVKISTQLLGPNEVALRLPALLAGIASLVLMVPLARKLGASWATTLAVVWIAALLPAWIRYSAEFKQYSMELLVTITLTLLTTQAFRHPSLRQRAPLLVGGFAAVLLSLSAPFVLGGFGTLLLVRDALARRWFVFAVTAVVASGRLLAFALHLHFLIDPTTLAKMNGEWWSDAFAPRSPRMVIWFSDQMFDYFEFLTQLKVSMLLVLFAIMGGVILRQAKREDAILLCLLPLILATLAAVAHVFPFHRRLILYLSGGIIVLVAIGIVEGLRALRPPIAGVFAGIAVLFVAVPLVYTGLRETVRQEDEPLPRLIDELARERRTGDSVYLHALALPLWRYYARRYPNLRSHDGSIVEGRDSRVSLQYFMADLQQLQGRRRVWLLLSRVNTLGKADLDLAAYVATLRGRVLRTRSIAGAELLLVDFVTAAPHDRAPAVLPPYRPIHSSYALDPLT